MAKNLLQCQLVDSVKRYGTGYDKLHFLNMASVTALSDLIDVDSWFLFRILQLDSSFFDVPSQNRMKALHF